jgi:hypothetical protein
VTTPAPPRYVTSRFSPGGALRELRDVGSGQLDLIDRMATLDSPVVATRFGPIPAATIADEVSSWPAETTFDMQACLTDLTLRVAAQTLIGLDVGRHELGPPLRHHFEGVVGWMSHRFYHLSAPPAVVPTRRNRRMAEDQAALTAIVRLSRPLGQPRCLQGRSGKSEAPVGPGPHWFRIEP